MLAFLFNFIFPIQCVGHCGRWDTPLCNNCIASASDPKCITDISSEHKIYSLGNYANPILQKAITNLKYGGLYDIAPTLGRQLKTILPLSAYDYVLPIPLYLKRKRERGFNQSELIASHLSMPILQPLERLISTRAQATLNREQRLENLSGIFAVIPSYYDLIPRARFLLVDDVHTTGSTIKACRDILLQAGANKVDAAVIAID